MLEEVQCAEETNVFNSTTDACAVEQPITADKLELPETEREVIPAVLEVPEEIVEVVVEEKIELEPEDPIFPDHFYDDGNIPVFKPVRFGKDFFPLYANYFSDDGPVSRLHEIHLSDKRVWHASGYRKSHSATRMVTPAKR